MNNENSYTEEFDAYIQGQLSAEDMAVFEQKIKSNPEFADAFKKHQLLVELIKENARLELKVYLNTHAKTKEISSNNWLQSKLFAIAATAIILIGAFVVFQFYSSPKLEENLAIETSLPTNPDNKRKEPSIERPNVNIIEAPEIYSEKDLLNEMPPPTIEELKSVEMGSLDDAAPPVMEDNAESRKDDAFVDYKIAQEIKNKDTFLYATALTMLDAEGKDNSYGFNKTSKAKSAQFPAAASNSNQAKALEDTKKFVDSSSGKKAKLSKPVATKTKYTVEYWTSPVNFKGYRLINNTIQLYGLDSYNGKLYTVNGSLYLRYSGKVYALAPCIDACPYKLEVDPDIIQFILNQN